MLAGFNVLIKNGNFRTISNLEKYFLKRLRMKKFIVFIVVIGAVYLIKPSFFPSLFTNGAFDKDGKPVVWVFTTDRCGSYCSDVIKLLNDRNIDYTEYDADNEEGKDLLIEVGGKNRFPLILVGSKSVVGNDKFSIVSMIAEGVGEEILTRSEQRVMSNHFYEGGEPMIVMYGTSWCGYCKKMRIYFDENDIDYTEFDAEGSGQQAYNILKGTGYPLMYIGYRRIKGANIPQLERDMASLNF